MELNRNHITDESDANQVALPPLRSLQPNAFNAVAYANRGWASFPLAASTKKPPYGSHGLSEATLDRAVLSKLFSPPNLNVGIRTGEISNLVVVDVDCHEGGANGHESIGALAKRGFLLPMGNAKHGTAMVSTPSGGLHLYYTIPEGVKLKNSSNEVAPGIDIRAEGGYVVAPPSKTPTGEYKWKQYPVRLMTAPEWLVESCKQTPPPVRQEYSSNKPTEQIPPVVAEVLKDRLDRIARATSGQRNHTLNREAFYLARFVGKGFDLNDLDDWLLNAAMSSGMPQYEARRTIDSALKSQSPRPAASGSLSSMHRSL